MLEDLWRKQKAFTALGLATIDKPIQQLTEDDRIRLTKDYIEYLHAELVEVLNNIPWKKHRYTGPSNRRNLVEELIDVQKFLWGLMQIWGISLEEFTDMFNEKSLIVEQRFRQEHILPSLLLNKKVAVVDIDDVVVNWTQGFADWAWDHYPDLPRNDYKKFTTKREALKDEIHGSGVMRDAGLFKNIGAYGVRLLAKAGYTIVYLTARPITKHPNLINDTVVWLKGQNLSTEYIYYSDVNKHTFILDNIPTASVLFDDDETIVENALKYGIPAYRIHASYTLFDKVEEFLSEVNKS
jgi:hypothetical protein